MCMVDIITGPMCKWNVLFYILWIHLKVCVCVWEGGHELQNKKNCWNVILLINFYVQWRTTVFWIFWGCLLVGKNCIQNLWILNRREYKYLHINNITEWTQWLSTLNGCLLQDRIYNYLYRTYCDVTLNLRFSDLNVILTCAFSFRFKQKERIMLNVSNEMFWIRFSHWNIEINWTIKRHCLLLFKTWNFFSVFCWKLLFNCSLWNAHSS